MANEVYTYVEKCLDCMKPTGHSTHQRLIKLFPPDGPLRCFAVDTTVKPKRGPDIERIHIGYLDFQSGTCIQGKKKDVTSSFYALYAEQLHAVPVMLNFSVQMVSINTTSYTLYVEQL